MHRSIWKHLQSGKKSNDTWRAQWVDELGLQHSPSHPACHDLGYDHDSPFRFLAPNKTLVPRILYPKSLTTSNTHTYARGGISGVMWPKRGPGLDGPALHCPPYLRVYLSRWWDVLMTTPLAPASKARATFLTRNFLWPGASKKRETTQRHPSLLTGYSQMTWIGSCLWDVGA